MPEGNVEARTISAKVNLSPKKYFPLPKSTYLFSNFPKKNLNFSSAFVFSSSFYVWSGQNKNSTIGFIKSSKAIRRFVIW